MHDDRQSRRTRRRIGEALLDVMREVRYDRITVQAIIDRADVGRSTFYAHYRDKEDVLVSETRRVLDALYRQFDDASVGHEGLLPSRALFEHVGEQHGLYAALLRGHGIAIMYDAVLSYLSTTVEHRLVATDGFTSVVPLPILANHVASSFMALLRWWLEHDQPYSAGDMDAMFQALVQGATGVARHVQTPRSANSAGS